MTMTPEELAQMSGETNYQNVQLPVYDEIGLNGNEGIFYVKRRTLPKIKEDDGLGNIKEVFAKEALGKTIELVWIKLRRKLIEKTQDGVVRQTSEHNTKADKVSIYHYNGGATEHGVIASEINGDDGLYPKMKVNQLVYAIDIKDGKIYKLILKGGSLSMQEKLENATLFYQYISSMEKGEHFYTMTNVITGTPYKTKLGVKFFGNFTKGRTLEPHEQETVNTAMATVHGLLTAYDNAKVKVDPIKAEVAPSVAGAGMDEMLDTIDYGDTGVNVDDIPF